ncbi:MAG: hypothetical protein AAF327_05895, partial [Cyanobacteria bacterium P01_A01_bin.37]
PVLGVVDALQTASVCRSTLLVSRFGHVSQSELTDAISLLERFNLIGLVANDDRTVNLSSYSYAQISQNSSQYEITATSSKFNLVSKAKEIG